MGPIDVRHPALSDLFDPAIPNAPMLFGILEGRLPGRAVADDPAAPRVAAIHAAEGIAFISRTTSQAALDAALGALRRDATLGLIWSGTEDGPVTPEAPAKVMPRLGFDPISPVGERLDRLRDGLPAGVTVKPMDAALLARCEWRELVESACGSIEAFLDHGVGLCLLRDDAILAEAYGPYIGRGVAEVGVVTAEAHRGQGLAGVAIAFLAAELADRSLAMYWSCDSDNSASVRVAAKLGFGAPRPFRVLLYRQLED